MIEAQFISFFVVLLVAVLFSALFSRLHLPWAVALIVGGIVVGPHGLAIFEPNDTIIFLGEIGIVFMMFMAGLETRLMSVVEDAKSISAIAFVNGIIPFGVGFLIGALLELPASVSVLIGIIFISSSVAVVIPTLTQNNLLGTRLGSAIIGSTMLQDMASLLLLSIFFQATNQLSSFPLPLFYLLLFAFLLFLRKVLPHVETFFSKHGALGQEIRAVLVVLIGVVVVFELLGLHPIIAGFFAGFVLSGTLKNQVLKLKLRAISYGLFVPIFFVVIGTRTDISVLASASTAWTIVALIIVGSVISKLVSGWLAAKWTGMSTYESNLVAATSIPQLSTTLAVAFSAAALGFINDELVAALVVLSIFTTLVAPLLTNLLIRNKNRASDVIESRTS